MKLSKFTIPIFTEEYKVIAFVGKRPDIIKAAAKYLSVSVKALEQDFANARGMAWNALDECYGNKYPVIIIDADLPVHVAMATIAHEASHAMDYIEKYVGINDVRGEVHAHGISAVMRAVGKRFLIKK